MERVAGATRGVYEIRGELGQGGMAAVYFARDLRLNRKVALKVMLPSLGLGEGFVDRFEEEARTAAKLDHPHIVTIYSVEEVGDLNFFVMKFIDGASLEELIRGAPDFPFDAARLILAQVSDALHYAHSEGVVHRDVKPANVMVDTRGSSTVTDFGISKTLDSPSRTQTGSVIGTPAFMSPEQWSGRPATGASDQYALGILGYQMLVGNAPFSGNQMELREKHLTEVPPSIVKLRPDCPPQLAAVVTRMLEKVPESRWPSLKAAATALRLGLPNDSSRIQTLIGELVTRAKDASNRQFEATPMSPAPRTRNPTPRAHPGLSPSGPFTPGGTQKKIVVSSNPGTVRVGEQTALHAAVTDDAGRQVAGQVVAWTSSNPSVAQVDPTGRIIAIAPGEVVVSAIAEGGGERTEVRLRVEPAPAPAPQVLRVHRVVIAKPADPFIVGRPVQLAAAVFDERGQAMARPVAWSCDAPGVAAVSRDGTLRGVSAGRAVVTAEVEGVSGQLAIQVVLEPVLSMRLGAPPSLVRVGDRFQLSATPISGTQTPLPSRTVTWKSDRSAIASVSDIGMVTASKSGIVVITATCEHQSATVSIEVQDLPLATIELAPSFGKVEMGKRLRVVARARDARGTRLDRPVRWTSSDERVARVSVDGDVTGVTEGEATITAHAEGVQGMMGLRVVPAVAQTPLAVQVRTFAVQARRLAAAQPRWVWAIPGALVLLLILWPFMNSSTDGGEDPNTPTPPAPAATALRVSGAPASLLPGDTVSLLAELGSDAAGWTRASDARWASRDERIALIDPASGAVTAVAPGRAVVVASTDTGTDSLLVTVSDEPVQSIEITPARQTLALDESVQLRARGKTARGRVTGDVAVTWVSSDPRVVNVDAATGVLRATGAGTAIITAQSGDLVNQLTVNVASAAIRIARIAIAQPPTMQAGGTSQLSARVFDSRGQPMEGATIAWSSDRPEVASVDASSGIVRARSGGWATIVASAGSVTSSVRVTVAAEAASSTPTYPSNPGATTPPAGTTPVGDEAQIQRAVGGFIEAMVAKNTAQISSWYDPKTDDDRRNMKRLVDLMANENARFRVGGDRVEYSVKVVGRIAVVEFPLKLEWRHFAGGTKTSTPRFRAEMRWAGSRWEIVNCRILGKATIG